MKVIALVLMTLCSFVAEAERVEDLYQYTTLVSGQGRREYNQALNDGLAEVIVRGSGSAQVLREPGIRNALGSASRYLLQHYYEATDQVLEVDGRELAASKLVLEYSGEAIEKLLRDLGLPLWPINRRSVLVWVVADDPQGRRIVTDVNFPDAQQAIEDSARRRGLPLVPKLMDLEDQIALSANQLWSMALDDIRLAAERYKSDAILAGRLSQTSRGDWRSDWQLIENGDIEVFDSEGLTVVDVIAGGIDQVADHFFKRYSINPRRHQSPEALLLQVGEIEDFSHYSNVLGYLDQLTVIRRIDLVAVKDDNLLLYLYTDGDVKLLQDTLALDAKLAPRDPVSNTEPLGSAGNPLLYAWRP